MKLLSGKDTMISRLLRMSLKSNLRLGSYIAVCFTLITETNAIPIIGDLSQRVSGKHDLNRVASSRLMKVPAIDTKLTPKQPLDKKHILLKELFKTARHLYIGQGQDLSKNPLVLDLNLKTLDNMLLDINPMINSKFSDKEINKGQQIVPLLSDILCKACKEKGDQECIRRHCLMSEYGSNGKEEIPEGSIVPILADTLCAACKAKNDPECIKIHCVKDDTLAKTNPGIVVLHGPPEILDFPLA